MRRCGPKSRGPWRRHRVTDPPSNWPCTVPLLLTSAAVQIPFELHFSESVLAPVFFFCCKGAALVISEVADIFWVAKAECSNVTTARPSGGCSLYFFSLSPPSPPTCWARDEERAWRVRGASPYFRFCNADSYRTSAGNTEDWLQNLFAFIFTLGKSLQ